MNLGKASNYHVGLDLGTASVGWAVVDDDGRLFHFKGQPTWGSRLFPEADHADDTRAKRGQRRRYWRRRQRIEALQAFFAKDMARVDPEFFVRLNQSRLFREDKSEEIAGFRWPLFNDVNFTEVDYYTRYPTIYHLRKALMESDERADLRLVYLALHHIVKFRGNFLYEDEGTSLKGADADSILAAQRLAFAVETFVNPLLGEIAEGQSLNLNERAVEVAMTRTDLNRADKRDAIAAALNPSGRDAKSVASEIAKASLGYKFKPSKIFLSTDGLDGMSLSLSDEASVEELASEKCPDDGICLLEAMRMLFSSYELEHILGGSSNVSSAMVASYEQHKMDLKVVKELVRDYCGPELFNDLFRGPKDSRPQYRGEYDINKVPKGGYTAYILGEKLANGRGCSHEDFIKHLREVLESNPGLVADARFKSIEARLDDPDSGFLSKQRTRANGAIPYQLQLEEMDAIIEHQGSFYPFLISSRKAIESLVSSRIPYYVGPLNTCHDPQGNYPDNPVDASRKFGWSVRKPGQENAKVYPWNVDEVIDKDRTAELFIRRMTGTCTYLIDEPVLPRHSLLYEEFCVLNELNVMKFSLGGGKSRRFDTADRLGIIRDQFETKGSYSKRGIEEWLKRRHGWQDVKVTGSQGESGLESRLSTKRDFCRLFGVHNLEDAPLTIAQMEEIVLWSTVYEDRDIFRHLLEEKYGEGAGGPLSNKMIKRIASRRYVGWGRLSRKLLCGITSPANVVGDRVSVMDVLRDGNPFNHGCAMNLMEVLSDDDLGFQEEIEKANRLHLQKRGAGLTVDEMHGSPANRRAVNQALRIVEEIKGIVGHAPASISIEVTRDEDEKKQGKRTSSRYQQLKSALRSYNDDRRLLGELDESRPKLNSEKLMLYFEQGGKCMYSGKPLDVNRLDTYQVDHIVPQAYIKDDSLENKALVIADYNQRKQDNLLLEDEIIDARMGMWRALKDAHLISERKFQNLTCRSISDRRLQGFINRQLVETSQIVKFTRQMCEERYPGTDVLSVRASVSHGIRENLGLMKCRELNDFHHAHDAFLACQVSRFISARYPSWQNGMALSYIKRYVKSLGEGGHGLGNHLGRSGFIADSFLRRGIDRDTGEITWDGQSECAYVKRALGYRQCFISRMTEEQTGAFWDETIYSPRDTKNGRNLDVPLKSNSHVGSLDPSKYGGHSNVSRAYWFIYAAIDKKGARKYFFEGVPVYKVSSLKGGDLVAFAEQCAHKHGCHDAVVLRKKIPLRQKFLLDGVPYYLCGASGQQNEIVAGKSMLAKGPLLAKVCKLTGGGRLEDDDCKELYDWIAESIAVNDPILAGMLRLKDREISFEGLDAQTKGDVLVGLLKRASGKAKVVDLRAIGGSSQSGKEMRNISTLLPHVAWVDQSVTGMFEHVTTFEELCHGVS